MAFNYDGKVFRSIANSGNGEVDGETRFYYRQQGDVVTADYRGGGVRQGQLMARVLPNGQLDMRYHHLNRDNAFMLGRCLSTPQQQPDGRLRLHEAWQWLSGDGSSGESWIEEVTQ